MSSDLYQQILDVIDAQDGGFAWRTIRVVAELHAPLGDPHYPNACSHCPADLGHPCETVKTIARELGIEATP